MKFFLNATAPKTALYWFGVLFMAEFVLALMGLYGVPDFVASLYAPIGDVKALFGASASRWLPIALQGFGCGILSFIANGYFGGKL